MTNFEKILGGIAFCLSDMTSFATEWRPSEAALEACRPRAACGSMQQVPVLLQRSGRALDDELVEGQEVEV